jgi:hypothetical protein
MHRSFRIWLSFSVIVSIGVVLSAPCAKSQTPRNNPQEEQPATHPEKQPRATIGVALEGGGALGLAHIGVLQWFEDHHIPIDYIAGTSMGGLVAGLYATGETPQQLAELVSAQKWDIIIGGKTPYEDLSYRRREDLRTFQNPIVVGLMHGLSLPAGLNAGQQISLLIRLGTPEFFSYAGRVGDTRLHFLTDHRDDPIAPHRGYSLNGAFQWSDTNPGATGLFPLMQARADYFLPVQTTASVFVVGEGGTSLARHILACRSFSWAAPEGSAPTARTNSSETNTMIFALATCTIS